MPEVGIGELFEVLNRWPRGTNGFDADCRLILELIRLFEANGSGAVTQMAGYIEDLKNYPDKLPEYKEMRRKRLIEIDRHD